MRLVLTHSALPELCCVTPSHLPLSIDDQAKDGGPEEVCMTLCNFYHGPLHT